MKELYLKLIELFINNNETNALFEECGLKPIAHLDIYRRQYVEPELHQPFPTPAIFFEYSTVWQGKGRKTQAGDSVVRIHIVLEVPAESYSGSPDQQFALSVFDYIEVVNYFLTGTDGPRQTGLQRTNEDPGFSEDPLLQPHILTYKCQSSDDTTDSLLKKYSATAKAEEISLAKTTPPPQPEPPEIVSGYLIE